MRSRLGYLLASLFIAATARAATDEIQVYDAGIAPVGTYNLTLHNNYTPHGVSLPDHPGGLSDEHTLNGVPEWALGVTDWWELGTYLPVYTLKNDGALVLDGVKLRSLFVVPDAKSRSFFYGMNFELSYNLRHWEETRFSGEIRPIIGYRIGPFDFIVNPIMDTQFRGGVSHLEFLPAARLAYNVSDEFALSLEHYADLGPLNGFEPMARQRHNLFAVLDTRIGSAAVEFGPGFGLTAASDPLILKLIVSMDL